MEKSYHPFLEDHTHDVHHRYSVFDTGIKAEGLAENYFVCLDIYRQYLHTKIKTKKEAWMLFLGSQSVEHILEVCDAFPEFIPLYERVFSYRKEASDMADIYYEALQIMNHNTELYMVEELQEKQKKLEKKIQEEQKKLREQQKKSREQQKKSQEQQEKMQEEIDKKDATLALLQEDKKQREAVVIQQEMEIQRLREQLATLQGK
jgi:septin family protein